MNVAFYGWVIWVGINFFRRTVGKERALVAGWLGNFTLGFIQHLVSTPDAAVIQHFKAISMAAAFGAAVALLVEGPARDIGTPENPTRAASVEIPP